MPLNKQKRTKTLLCIEPKPTHAYTHTHTHTHLQVYINMYVCMYECVYVRALAFVFV